jgi:dTDP-4-amino-4,6-dideoxygalactose transaminase
MPCSRTVCAVCASRSARQRRALEIGYNERLDGLQAALPRVELPHLDAWNSARHGHALRCRESLPAAAQLLAERPDSQCVYHLFSVRFQDQDGGAALQAHGIPGLLRESGFISM